MEIKPRVLYINGKVIYNTTGTRKVVISNCRNGYEFFDLRTECISQYKMNDTGSGTTVEDSQGYSNGTASTPISNLSTTGKINGAFEFNGALSEHIDTNSNFNTVLNNSFSVSLWFYKSSFTATEYLIGGADADSSFELYLTPVRSVGICCITGAIVDPAETSSNILPLSSWTHLVLNAEYSITNYIFTLYINGEEVENSGQTSDPFSAYSSTENLYIGALNDIGSPSSSFNGKIDNVCIFNRLLTVEEVNGIYNQGYGDELLYGCGCDGTEVDLSTSLVAHYKLNEANGIIVHDDSGNNHDGAPYNSTDTSNITSVDAPAKQKNSFYINGNADNCLLIDDHDDFSFTDGSSDTEFSISFWIKSISYDSSAQFLISKYAVGSVSYLEWIIGVSNYGIIFVSLYDSSSELNRTATNALTNSIWNHIVITYNGESSYDGLIIYVNGVISTSSGSETGSYAFMSNTDAKVCIGGLLVNNSNPTANLFNGYIDNIAIWKNKELTGCEVRVLYNNGYGTEILTNGCCPTLFSSSSSKSSSSSSRSSSSSSRSSSSRSSSSSSRSSSSRSSSSSSRSSSSRSSSSSSRSSSSRSSSSSSRSSSSSSVACADCSIGNPYYFVSSVPTNNPPNGVYSSDDIVNPEEILEIYLSDNDCYGNDLADYFTPVSGGEYIIIKLVDYGTFINFVATAPCEYLNGRLLIPVVYDSIVGSSSDYQVGRRVCVWIDYQAISSSSSSSHSSSSSSRSSSSSSKSSSSSSRSSSSRSSSSSSRSSSSRSSSSSSKSSSSSSRSSSSRSSSSSSKKSSSSSSNINLTSSSSSGSSEAHILGNLFIIEDISEEGKNELFNKYLGRFDGKGIKESEDILIQMVVDEEISPDEAIILADKLNLLKY